MPKARSVTSTALSAPTARHSRSAASAFGGPIVMRVISAPYCSLTLTAAERGVCVLRVEYRRDTCADEVSRLRVHPHLVNIRDLLYTAQYFKH